MLHSGEGNAIRKVKGITNQRNTQMGWVLAPGTAWRTCAESPTRHLGTQSLLGGAEFPLLPSLVFLAGLRTAQPTTEPLGFHGGSASGGTGYGEKDLGNERGMRAAPVPAGTEAHPSLQAARRTSPGCSEPLQEEFNQLHSD